jgi:hypothetical protein
MDFRADPTGYRAEDGRTYTTEEEAKEASRKHWVMSMLLHIFKYNDQRQTEMDAKMLLELESRKVITLDWDRVDGIVRGLVNGLDDGDKPY